MPTSPDSSAASPKDSGASTLIVRVALVVVLIAAVVVLVLEKRVESEAKSAYDKVQARLDAEENAQGASSAKDIISPAVVEEIVGKAPSNTATEPDNIVHRFDWPGTIRTYYVVATFQPGAAPYLRSVKFTTDPMASDEVNGKAPQ
jgi:hypothetical protein